MFTLEDGREAPWNPGIIYKYELGHSFIYRYKLIIFLVRLKPLDINNFNLIFNNMLRLSN